MKNGIQSFFKVIIKSLFTLSFFSYLLFFLANQQALAVEKNYSHNKYSLISLSNDNLLDILASLTMQDLGNASGIAKIFRKLAPALRQKVVFSQKVEDDFRIFFKEGGMRLKN